MLRTITLCLLVAALAVQMYPDVVSAREWDTDPAGTTVVHGSIVRAAFKNLSLWIVAPKEWRLPELLTPRKEPDLSTTNAVPEPPAQKPEFAYSDLVLKTSEKYGMDWRLVASVIAAESSFHAHALSSVGARGLMQVMPTTAALYRVKSQDLFDPTSNLEAGVQHLKWLSDRYSGNVEKMVAAYNSGEGCVDRYRGVPPYKTTRAFVRKVMTRYQNHLAMFPPAGKTDNSTSIAALHPVAAY